MADLVKQDQKERKDYQTFIKQKAKGDWETGVKLWIAHKKRSADDVFGEKKRLAQFTKADLDFPSFDDDDWENYWLLCQHCDFNLAFQKKALQNIKKHLGTNNEHYKYLSDRISMATSGRQKYGTQDM